VIVRHISNDLSITYIIFGLLRLRKISGRTDQSGVPV
jgi:hypothetical protein